METRFVDAQWFKKATEQKVVIVGLGGIGSWAALALARLEVDKLILLDFDVLEEHNTGSQLCSFSQMGDIKSYALSTLISRLTRQTNTSIIAKNAKVNESSTLGYCLGYSRDVDVVLAATDNIESRSLIFSHFLDIVGINESMFHLLPDSRIQHKKKIYLDARMTAEFFELYAVPFNRISIAAYKSTLFQPEESEQLPCGYQQTSHTGMILGGLIASVLVNFCTTLDEEQFLNFREIPFKTTMNLQTLSITKQSAYEVLDRNREDGTYGWEEDQ